MQNVAFTRAQETEVASLHPRGIKEETRAVGYTRRRIYEIRSRRIRVADLPGDETAQASAKTLRVSTRDTPQGSNVASWMNARKLLRLRELACRTDRTLPVCNVSELHDR